MITDNYENDVPYSTALDAARGTYSMPERKAENDRKEYARTLATDLDVLTKLADTVEKNAILVAEFDRYRAGYRSRTLVMMGAESRCVSWFIAGPANFPARKMQKRYETASKRTRDLLEYRERALKAIRRKLQPEKAPIKSGDADAIQRLQAKIQKAEAFQDLMKKANKIVKAKPKDMVADAKVAELVTLGMSEETAHKLFEKDWCGRTGFPSYELTNNNANIRRMKARVKKISCAQATPDTLKECAAARIEDCPADNRVRLFFPGKPDVEIRTRLKRSGFRWARSLGCWQAYRNTGSLAIASDIAGKEVGP